MTWTCHQCKSALALPSAGAAVGFRESCPKCGTDLHCCLNCAFYDPGAYHECRESQAEFVQKKDRSNRCDYFRPATSSADAAACKAKQLADLDDLFKK